MNENPYEPPKVPSDKPSARTAAEAQPGTMIRYSMLLLSAIAVALGILWLWGMSTQWGI